MLRVDLRAATVRVGAEDADRDARRIEQAFINGMYCGAGDQKLCAAQGITYAPPFGNLAWRWLVRGVLAGAVVAGGIVYFVVRRG
jgi:hypothetical protein